MKILICIVISFLCGMLFMDYIMSKEQVRENKEYRIDKEKIVFYYRVLNVWMDMKQRGKFLGEYMRKQGYQRVAIYGMKELGERLYAELMNDGIEVVCVIDSRKNVLGDFKLISPEDEIPAIDLLVVTADYYFYEIEKKMREKIDCPIMSLSGLLGNAFNRII